MTMKVLITLCRLAEEVADKSNDHQVGQYLLYVLLWAQSLISPLHRIKSIHIFYVLFPMYTLKDHLLCKGQRPGTSCHLLEQQLQLNYTSVRHWDYVITFAIEVRFQI